MKKIYTTFVAAALLIMGSGCTALGNMGMGSGTGSESGNGTLGDVLGGVLGGILGGLGSQNTIDGLLGLVILAKAGGAVAAEHCKEKLLPVYNTVGINAQNTQFQFTQDHQFAGKIKGIPLSGSYTYDPSTGTIRLQTMLFSTNAYITRTQSGLGLTFESKNLLKVLQVAAALSGNSTLQTVGDLSKQYEGVRLGFELAPIR